MVVRYIYQKMLQAIPEVYNKMYRVASLTFAILSSTRCQTPTTDKPMISVMRWMEVTSSSNGWGDKDDGDDEDDNDVVGGWKRVSIADDDRGHNLMCITDGVKTSKYYL